MNKVVYQLDTLTCPSCMQKIETAVNKQPGVKNVRVLFNSSKVKVELNRSKVSATDIKQVIEKLGYTVKNLKETEIIQEV
ncbi:heavy-metal-associated domain-containing protein [Lactobacillus terrae]|uniref:heavy-metal-associated domain-containing protein n=1 Tax=Lactobacillus terrae TaxID=2269374 RepID=UPI000C1B7AF7|nr:cation transporter [Lactobacillus terrae]